MKKIDLNITGMHCPSCVMLIKDVLGDNKGITASDVDLKKGKANVSYDEKLTSETQIIKSITDEGYTAKLVK